MSKRDLSALLMALLFSAACARINSYQKTTLVLEAAGSRQVLVAVHDQRPYVVNGDQDETYQGLEITTFGIHRSAATPEGRPLAEEMGASLAKSIGLKGFQCQVAETDPGKDPGKTLAELKERKAERIVLVTLKEWKAKGFADAVTLYYDIQLAVLDKAGKTLYSDEDSDLETPLRSHAMDGTYVLYKKVFEDMLNDPNCVAAMR